VPERHVYSNLAEVPECVISYIGMDLMEESWIAGLPIPKGISELDVAGLTPLPSRKVGPCGIAECGVNMEAEIVSVEELGEGARMFLAKVVAVSVDRELLAANDAAELRTGVLAIDPLFEVLIERSSPEAPERLYYARLDTRKLYRTSDEVGSSREWIGSFVDWLASEQDRGRIDASEREEILRLSDLWSADPSPVRNGQARDLLTRKLREMVWHPKDDWPGVGMES
jgi:flavin reductase (DIM6/NTAB) family NADH-FMN oxidoreductase RutF